MKRLPAFNIVSLVLFGISACGTSNVDQQTEPDATIPLTPLESGTHTIMHEGLERSFILHVPENLPSSGIPLVFVLHGYSGTAQNIQRYSGIDSIADTNKFIAVYPEGTKDDDGLGFFNVGYDFHPNETVDDVSFIATLIRNLQTNPEISSTDVFSTGMSNGGEMSYMLGCQASNLFKAVASVAGIMFESFSKNCNPSRPPAVLEIHGTDDTVNWYGGDSNNSGGWGNYIGIDEGIAFWVELNELDQFETINLPDNDSSDGSTVIFNRYWSDQKENEVWLYQIEGGGHDWPGSFGNMDINSSEIIWSFFSRQR